MFKNRAKRLFGASKLAQQQQRRSQQASQQVELTEQPPVAKQKYFDFETCHRTYSCAHCRAHLADHDQLISKLFQGNHGRAYLFNTVVNIGCKQAVQRELLTGLHAVADIYCDNCETTLGWKYEQAFVPSQKYKEGKYIIELAHMLKENNWDLTSYNARELIKEARKSAQLATSNSNDINGSCHANNTHNCCHEYHHEHHYCRRQTPNSTNAPKTEVNAIVAAATPAAVIRALPATEAAASIMTGFIDDRLARQDIGSSDNNNNNEVSCETQRVADAEKLAKGPDESRGQNDNPIQANKDKNNEVNSTKQNPPSAARPAYNSPQVHNNQTSETETTSTDLNADRQEDGLEMIERSLVELMVDAAAVVEGETNVKFLDTNNRRPVGGKKLDSSSSRNSLSSLSSRSQSDLSLSSALMIVGCDASKSTPNRSSDSCQETN